MAASLSKSEAEVINKLNLTHDKRLHFDAWKIIVLVGPVTEKPVAVAGVLQMELIHW